VQGISRQGTEGASQPAGKSFGFTPLAHRLQRRAASGGAARHDAAAPVLRYNYAVSLILESTVR